MGYLVATSGRVLLPEHTESAATPAVHAAVSSRSGPLTAATSVHGIEELARYVGVRAVRDGDWLLLATDREGQPVWSEQTSAFYAAIAPWVHEGEVRVTGADGTQWSYTYSSTGVSQAGVNGYDGSTALPTVELAAPQPRPQAAAPPEPPLEQPPPPGAPGTPWPPAPASSDPSPADPFFADDEPAPRSPGRTVAMTLLLIFGVLAIVAVAMLAAGAV